MNVLYFIGAGASASIDPAGSVPCMTNFFEKVVRRFGVGTPVEYWLPFACIEEARCFPANSQLETLGSSIRALNWIVEEAKLESARVDYPITVLQDIQSKMDLLLEQYGSVFLKNDDRTHANLENVLSNILAYEEKTGDKDAFQRMLFLLNRMFFDLDKDLKSAFDTTPHHELAKFISMAPHEHTFVSFNYDLWLEKAFYKQGIWLPQDGHGIQFQYYLPPLGDTMIQGVGSYSLYELSKFGDGAGHSKTSILKPHGSFSWWTNRGIGDHSIVAIMLESEKEEGNVGYNSEGFSRLYRFVNPLTQGEMALQALIVPPIPIKERSHSIFWETDKNIDSAIKRADVIVTIGWSMPETDRYIHQLIQHAMHHRDRQIEKLIVCDIKPGPIVQKLEPLFMPRHGTIEYSKGFTNEFVQAVLKSEVGQA